MSRADWCAQQRAIRRLCWVEMHLNHPYWHAWAGSPGSHWGPLSERLCDFMDWATGGYCHD